MTAGIVLVALLVILDVDPARGFTISNSPFTDEGHNVVNSRNYALLGRWSTDDWDRHLINVPFNAIEAGAFLIAGVGLEQARIMPILATAATVLVLAVGLWRPLGGLAATVAAAGVAGAPLVLYYGRLAFQESFVLVFLAGSIVVVANTTPGWRSRSAVLAGALMALAIGSKAIAALPVAGMLLGLAALSWQVPWWRAWLAIVVAVIVAAALAWAAVIGIPHWDQVQTTIRTWPAEPLPVDAAEYARRAIAYVTGGDDGALVASLPLLVLALLALAAWRARPPDDPAGWVVAISAVGWIAVTTALLLAIPYRPNRYFVPEIVPLAILAGIAVRELARRLPDGWPRAATAALALAIVVLPGLVHYRSWLEDGTRELPRLQAEASTWLSPGEAAAGAYAPTFLLAVPVVTVIPWPETGVNADDLYDRYGVRLVVDGADVDPTWLYDDPAVWAAGQRLGCWSWGATGSCVTSVP
jgi:hypothetical protein